jgi:hypothetical protein
MEIQHGRAKVFKKFHGDIPFQFSGHPMGKIDSTPDYNNINILFIVAIQQQIPYKPAYYECLELHLF